jgi:hypothetical protein
MLGELILQDDGTKEIHAKATHTSYKFTPTVSPKTPSNPGTPACRMYHPQNEIVLVVIFHRFKALLNFLMSRRHLNSDVVCTLHLIFPTAGKC